LTYGKKVLDGLFCFCYINTAQPTSVLSKQKFFENLTSIKCCHITRLRVGCAKLSPTSKNIPFRDLGGWRHFALVFCLALLKQVIILIALEG